MNPIPAQLLAVIKTDFLIRFRRMSTIVTFLVLCMAAYIIVPAPSSGMALMVVGGRRALLNSASISLATSMLCSTLLTLVGFYLVSNSLRRDIQSRTGFIIAATPTANLTYIAGKFFGNVVFLSAITLGFMLSVMGMHLLRGEAPLQPIVYVASFVAVVWPGIFFVSSIALVFESINFLSGKFGDVLYFFVWTFVTAASAIMVESELHDTFAAVFDIEGLGVMISSVMAEANTEGLSIGASEFDRNLAPYVFSGVSMTWSLLAMRVASMTLAVPIVGAALLFFHRFNPTSIKASARESSWNPLSFINTKLKPLTQRFVPFASLDLMRGSLFGAIWVDSLLSIALSPITILALGACAVLSVVLPHAALVGLLPVFFFGLVILLADVPTRDRAAGLERLLYTVPLLKMNFVWWKLGVALVLSLSFTILPMLRLLPSSPSSALSLLIGVIFIGVSATALGVASGSPKAFAVCFLLFMYVVLNGGGVPALDFAGWLGIATSGVQMGYALTTVGMILATQSYYTWRLRREG